MWEFFVVAMFIFFFGLFIGLPGVAIWAHHRRKMEELKIQQQLMVDKNVQAQLDAIRAEIQSLRDTTLQYDLSFDTNLQEMERRLHALERQSSSRPMTTEEATQPNVLLGGR
jgi:hypothetical protein